jgi:hypothetical protein
MNLHENIDRIKSIMSLNESESELQDLFNDFISMNYPQLDNPKIEKHKEDIWIDGDDDELYFTYFPLANEKGKFAITHVDDELNELINGMFGEYTDTLLKTWFKNKFGLHVDYILE